MASGAGIPITRVGGGQVRRSFPMHFLAVTYQERVDGYILSWMNLS